MRIAFAVMQFGAAAHATPLELGAENMVAGVPDCVGVDACDAELVCDWAVPRAQRKEKTDKDRNLPILILGAFCVLEIYYWMPSEVPTAQKDKQEGAEI
jgi:hypothetical protein